MPAKGHKVSEATRLKMVAARAQHKPHIVGRYGLTEEYVREQLDAGKIWCSDCKSFLESNLFGNGERKVRCKPCTSKRNIGRYAKDPERYRNEKKANYHKNLEHSRSQSKNWQFTSYGVSREWYETKLAEQDGKCAICGAEKPDGRCKYLYIDHQHACCSKRPCCGKCVRGLLCLRCNSFVERFDSNPGWAEKALAYLARYR